MRTQGVLCFDSIFRKAELGRGAGLEVEAGVGFRDVFKALEARALAVGTDSILRALLAVFSGAVCDAPLEAVIENGRVGRFLDHGAGVAGKAVGASTAAFWTV